MAAIRSLPDGPTRFSLITAILQQQRLWPENFFSVSEQCDGVRCDMAMLILPEVFEKTWGRRAQTFWPLVIKGRP
ncbi:MAG: hypothetical protein MZV63_49775 [Marinilabiliales bacterium]|nr:hypothetical protein [Marinilabiliales bacterium]